jgi:hypothetical protein
VEQCGDPDERVATPHRHLPTGRARQLGTEPSDSLRLNVTGLQSGRHEGVDSVEQRGGTEGYRQKQQHPPEEDGDAKRDD